MQKRFTIAVFGLGMMGGSFAYALRGFQDGFILGYDPNEASCAQALASGAVDAIVSTPEEAAEAADIALFCSSPETILQNMRRTFPVMRDGCIVSEICGVKSGMVAFIDAALPGRLAYVGIHPMAGRERGGFENADAALLRGAGFILVTAQRVDPRAVALVQELCEHVGARRVLQNTAHEHDEIIGYTSDLMHIAAVALCAQYPENMTMAHTAGAFRDCTRIAQIDAELWTQLLIQNRGGTLAHLRRLQSTLAEYQHALETQDEAALHALLAQAARNKAQMQGL